MENRIERLELKYLAPYLPYGLKINTIENELISIDIENKKLESKFRGHLINVYEWDEIKPILRNLSDLTKEIEYNGEKFVPILELAKTSDSYYKWEIDKLSLFFKSAFCKHYTGRISFSVNTNLKTIYSFNTSLDGSFIQTNNPHLVYEKLLELHFDVFGLIEKGLAIDINTLTLADGK